MSTSVSNDPNITRESGDVRMALDSDGVLRDCHLRQTIPTWYQCGLKVFPVSSSVFRRERIRGHPSAQAA